MLCLYSKNETEYVSIRELYERIDSAELRIMKRIDESVNKRIERIEDVQLKIMIGSGIAGAGAIKIGSVLGLF